MARVPISLIILTVFDLPAFVFHLSMLIFLLSRILKKNPFYRQGFYELFCAVTIVDLFYIAINYALYRTIMLGIFVDFYRGWNLGAKLDYELTGYCAWFQACAHTLIAFNRFTVFYFHRIHAKIWSGRCMVLLLIGLCILPLFGLTVGISAPVGYIFSADGVIAVGYLDKNISQMNKIVGMAYYFPLSIIGFTLNTFSLIRYRRHTRSLNVADSQYINQESRLLVHTIFMLIAQMIRALYYVTWLASILLLSENASNKLVGIMQENLAMVADAYSLLGSVFLFALSATVRQDYLKFYGWKKKECPKKESIFTHVTNHPAPNIQTVP